MERPSRLIILGVVYSAAVWLGIGRTPLWMDEIQQLDSARQRTIHQIVEWAKLNPAAVPLPYMVQQEFIAAFGYSTIVARIPAALCGILCGIVFACIAYRLKLSSTLWATALFLAAPLQFRYAIEARGYSQGLLFSLLAFLIFLELCRRPSIGMAILYALAIALGLYSQPFSFLPVAGQLVWLMLGSADRRARWFALIAAGAACLSFIPWWMAQSEAKRLYPQMAVYFFSWRQVAPWTLSHDFPGGGYIPFAALFSLVLYGLVSSSLKDPRKQLLVCMGAISIVAPIAADAAGSYFFAPRQFLFALPPILLLGSLGLDRLFEERRRGLAFAALAAFLIPAVVKDYREASVPRDDLAATADRIEAEITPGACVLVAPRNQFAYYRFFHPDLALRGCPENPDSQTILAVEPDPHATAADRAELAALPARGYQPERSIEVGHARITLYRR